MYRSLTLFRRHVIPVGTILLVLGASAGKLWTYLDLSQNAIWLVLLPFIIYIKDRERISYRYGVLSAILIALYALSGAPILLFFSVFFVIFTILEAFYGRLNHLAPVAVIVVTPLTRYLFDIFGFPIRLFLSRMAAVILRVFNMNVLTHGNELYFHGEQFTVDVACMGLHMVITSLLICLLLISYFERQKKGKLPLHLCISAMGIAILLVIFANLLRIILLVLFRSPAETVSHELIGIACLVLAVILPLYYLIKRFATTITASVEDQKQRGQTTILKYLVVMPITLATVVYGLRTASYYDMPRDEAIEQLKVSGYKKDILSNHIVRFTSSKALIYIKPGKEFFRSNHDPSVCWRGSGYSIRNATEQEWGGKRFYVARLAAGHDQLYTAWWYDNGECQTASQLDWRWKSLQGAPPFRLVNVTVHSQRDLIREVSKWMAVPLPFNTALPY